MIELNPLVPRLFLPLMRAIGKAPHVLSFDAGQLQAAIAAQELTCHGEMWQGMGVAPIRLQ